MVYKYNKGNGKKLTENFRVSEFSCKGDGCCSETLVDDRLVETLQAIRNHFGKRVYINSGYRCVTHNKRIGGVSGSYHLKGMAADIMVDGVEPAEVAKYAESIGVKGIGLYPTFVHVDTRPKKSFWYGQQQEKRETFGGSAPVEEPVEDVENALRILAAAVIRGDFGNGAERKERLYKAVQDKVGELLGA